MILKRNSDTVRKLVQDGDIDKINQAINDDLLDVTATFQPYNVTVWHLLAEGKSDRYYIALETLLKRHAYYLYNNTYALNQIATNGLTPILYAADVGNLRAIRLLVTFGADPTFETKPAPNAFCPYGMYNAINLLKQHSRRDLIPEMEDIINQQEQLRASLNWNKLLLEQALAEERKEQESLQKFMADKPKQTTSNILRKGIYKQFKTFFSYCHRKEPLSVACDDDEYIITKKLL